MTNRVLLIAKIHRLPGQIAELVEGLTDAQLTARPLAGEWSVAQNVHHLADSHMNSYIRCKLILTEEHPTLKPYDQEMWAELPDASGPDAAVSLSLLTALHNRWVVFWENLPTDAWARTGSHPANGNVSLDDLLEGYAAHGESHIEQITRTRAAGQDAYFVNSEL
ncbi:MAG: DinB family protein [Caldilineaceae bacterium]|nr:DinB family protein [Caldilineaceae bacterium]HRJ41900.1 DinB family protein [Caldilineaceae bacterium]